MAEKGISTLRSNFLIHINQPTSRPTLRWVFQLLEGIHQVSLDVDGQVTSVMDGMTELRGKILQLFGKKVSQIYYISSA